MTETYDMSLVTQPKSDQINADDLIAGPMTITIREVRISPGEDQPCSIFFEGSDKAWRPSKGMRRLLMAVWGADARQYAGKSVTLFRDPSVKFGADETGGIRVSHMSHMDAPRVVATTMKRGVRKGWKVVPLVDAPKPAEADPRKVASDWANRFISQVNGLGDDVAAIDALFLKHGATIARLAENHPDLASSIETKRPAKADDAELFAAPEGADGGPEA